jgi:hypothetical protein
VKKSLTRRYEFGASFLPLFHFWNIRPLLRLLHRFHFHSFFAALPRQRTVAAWTYRNVTTAPDAGTQPAISVSSTSVAFLRRQRNALAH